MMITQCQMQNGGHCLMNDFAVCCVSLSLISPLFVAGSVKRLRRTIDCYLSIVPSKYALSSLRTAGSNMLLPWPKGFSKGI